MAFLAGNDYGVNDGSPYWDQRLNKPSLLGQLDHAHKSWKEYVQNIPYGGYLGDCYPIFCQAVGDSVPVTTGNAASLIEYGSATGGWKTVPSPDPGAPRGNTILDGVLAFSSSNIWAVGTYDGKGGMKTLILHYTGGAI